MCFEGCHRAVMKDAFRECLGILGDRIQKAAGEASRLTQALLQLSTSSGDSREQSLAHSDRVAKGAYLFRPIKAGLHNLDFPSGSMPGEDFPKRRVQLFRKRAHVGRWFW
jgi:hypothetical protein